LSLAIHSLVIGALLVRAAARPSGDGHSPDAAGSSRGERPGVNFFALLAPGPAAVELPSAPRVQPTDIPSLERVPLDLPRVDLVSPHAVAAAPQLSANGGGTGAGGGGGGGGGGAGAGGGAGSGTEGEGDYIYHASPRTLILPPLAKPPGSVSGRTYRIRFWVAADGRVTRVEVDPPIADQAYRREFLERMMAYQFYPAHTRDGANVASVETVPLTIGN